MKKEKLKELIGQMTLEEKASFCSGEDFWHTQGLPRLGIPAVMVSDGPHGLRKQDESADHLGLNGSIPAVCFPAGCGLAASFNRQLIQEMGKTLGQECQAEGVSVILGPAVNIKRSPLCGRNFEYYSEDPLVASEMAGALIEGVQSKNVGTSIKHFLANNQETRRMSCSSQVDERALREIYLAAFEGAVTKKKPWTVMCSYNRINGVYAAENKKYLTDVLRREWGFDGYVMSDWGAVNDRVADLEAGLDLEMPSYMGLNDKLIVEAVRNGTLKEETVDQAVERILNIVFRFEENRDKNAVFDRDKDHEQAKQVAEETIVLLKNEDNILPFSENKKIAFIGEFAEKPRYQGGGSSHINSHRVVSALKAARDNTNIIYAKGYLAEQEETDGQLLMQAVQAAKEADGAVIFAGLPDSFESEGFDRTHMSMPECQNKLIEEIARVQLNVVVVLHNGSPVEMPWISRVKGVLEAYLGGQAVGSAAYDILFGKVNPSAKLPETFPVKLEDNPSYLNFPGEKDIVAYKEGIFVGYRYYDKKKMDVLFPFGHGLSYTAFEYSHLKLDSHRIKDTDKLKVSLDVTNTGNRAGKEIVQIYVSDKESTVIRPVKELREFAKVELQPGETKTVSFTLDKRAFAYYNTQIHDWHVESGDFAVMAGRSSRDIVLSEDVYVESTVTIPVHFTTDSTLGDVMENPGARQIVEKLFAESAFGGGQKEEETSPDTVAASDGMMEAMMRYMPLRGILSFGGEAAIGIDQLQKLVDKLNQV